VKYAVSDENAKERRKAIEESQRRANATAAPLPVFITRMIEKINQWALDMSGITDDDLDGLPEGADLDQVIRAVQWLTRECKRWEARLDRTGVYWDVIDQ
jgi:hypothetical protein